jgi:hypothetical protein
MVVRGTKISGRNARGGGERGDDMWALPKVAHIHTYIPKVFFSCIVILMKVSMSKVGDSRYIQIRFGQVRSSRLG